MWLFKVGLTVYRDITLNCPSFLGWMQIFTWQDLVLLMDVAAWSTLQACWKPGQQLWKSLQPVAKKNKQIQAKINYASQNLLRKIEHDNQEQQCFQAFLIVSYRLCVISWLAIHFIFSLEAWRMSIISFRKISPIQANNTSWPHK